MYRVRLDEEARRELHQRTRRADTKRRTRDRLEIVRLSDAGWSVPRIAQHMGVCAATARAWLKVYLDAGFDALADKRHLGPPSALTPQILQAVREHIRQSGRTWTAPQLAEWIGEEFGVHVSAGWLSEKLHAARLSYQRTSRHLGHKQKPEEVSAAREEKEALEKRGTRAS